MTIKIQSLMILIAITFICTAEEGHSAPLDFNSYQLKISNDLQLDFRNFIDLDALSLSELTALAKDASDYGAFLASLFRRAPYLFENYVLMHATGSIQHASKEHPRVVLFGDGLMLAFDDRDDDQRRLEVISFNLQTYSFSFHEIFFHQGQDTVVDKSPKSCAACHGDPGRPIWESYDFWPNAYGSAVSRFQSEAELATYIKLFNPQINTGIYRYLKNHVVTAFGEKRLNSLETFTLYAANLSFLNSASTMNLNSSELKPLKYALYAALGRCTERNEFQFEELFPKETFNSAKIPFDKILESTKAERDEYKEYLKNTYKSRFPEYIEIFHIDHNRLAKEAVIMAQVRFIFENIGKSVEPLTLSSGFNRYFMSTPSNFALDLRSALAVFDRDELLAIGAGATNFVAVDCQKLREMSLRSLRDFRFPTTKILTHRKAAPVAHCIRCHTIQSPTADAPSIPFDDTEQLRAMFIERPEMVEKIRERIRSSGSQGMPPYVGLSDSEIKTFDAFLNEVTQ